MDIVRFCYMEIFFMPVCTLTSSVWVPISNIWSNSQIFASRLDAKKKKKFSVVTVLLWMWASFYIESHSCFFPTKIVYWCYLLVFLLYWFFFLVIRSNWSVTFFFFFWSVTLSETPFLLQDYLKKEILLEILSFFKLWNYSVFL